MKKGIKLFAWMFLCLGLAGCGDVSPEAVQSREKPKEEPTMCSIHVNVGNTVLEGILYDNPTAKEFLNMLPLTVETWHAAPDFARAFDLPEQLEQKGEPGYAYELGSLAYWDDGPSVALIYKESRTETVVPVVPIGKITSDVSLFEEYEGGITIEIAGEVVEPSKE